MSRTALHLGLLMLLAIALGAVTKAIWWPRAVSAQDATETQLGVVLSANQEVPPVSVATTAQGLGTITVNVDRTVISYTFTLTGPFTGVPLQAHIHAGPTGTPGPILFFLCATDPAVPALAPVGIQACPDASGGVLSGTLTEAEFMPQPEAGIATFADAVAALSSGDAYVNLHTQANLPGEIRGQIGSVGLGAILTSAAAMPPVTTATLATGTATLTINPERTEVAYSLTLTGPFTGDPLQIHIAAGTADSAGPVLFFLCATDPAVPAPVGVQPCPTAAGGTVNGTLTEADLVAQPDADIVTFADAIAALMSYDVYVNVPTVANPPGEIRGQIGVALHADLTSAAEVLPVITPTGATAEALLVFNQEQSQMAYVVTLTGPLTGDPVQMHINAGAADSAGPILFFLCATDPAVPAVAPVGVQACPTAVGGTVSGVLTETDVVAQPDVGIVTFADAVAALTRGNAYVNLPTPANLAGEIRGQIAPVQPVILKATLTSAAEIPPVTIGTQATGTATLTLHPGRRAVFYELTLTGPFTGDPLQMHIHAGLAEAEGPILFFLCATDLAMPAAAPVDVQACPTAAGGTVRGVLTEADLVAQPDVGIVTFADAVAALVSDGTYVNLHTPANPMGEIRGQLELVQPPPEPVLVSFSLQIQPIFNANCSCHLFPSPAAGMSLREGESFANLVSVPSGQRPDLHRVEPGDPDNSYLFMKHSGAPGILNNRMPLDNPSFFDRNPDLLELERQWILAGAPNN